MSDKSSQMMSDAMNLINNMVKEMDNLIVNPLTDKCHVCNNGKVNCNHSSTFFKKGNKLLQLEEMLWKHEMGFLVLCDENLEGRKEQKNDIVDWMMGDKGWTRGQIDDLFDRYLKEIELAHGVYDPDKDSNVSDILVACSEMANRTEYISDEHEEGYYLGHEEAETIAIKAERSYTAKLNFWNGFIYKGEAELKLHDKMADFIEPLVDVTAKLFRTMGKEPCALHLIVDEVYARYGRQLGNMVQALDRKFKACFARLDILRFEEKRLGYNGWLTFNNVLFSAQGRTPKEDKWNSALLPDKLVEWEAKREIERNNIELAKELVTGLYLEDESYEELAEEIGLDGDMAMEMVNDLNRQAFLAERVLN